jgi:hypothetical protein
MSRVDASARTGAPEPVTSKCSSSYADVAACAKRPVTSQSTLDTCTDASRAAALGSYRNGLDQP